MRIGIYYKWYKEGKIDCSQAEISSLWKKYEGLSSYSTNDRKLIEAYSSLMRMMHHPEDYVKEEGQSDEEFVEELAASEIAKLNRFFKEEREEPKYSHDYLLY